MRICPLCESQYGDDVEFCFKDGSPLDLVEDGPVDVDPELEAFTRRTSETSELQPIDPESLRALPDFPMALASEPPRAFDAPGPVTLRLHAPT